MEPVEAEALLPDELVLLEYEANTLLFRRQESLRQYLEKGWLKPDFRGGPCISATHFVGLMPFRSEDRDHLIMVAPKGCIGDATEKSLGLLRFLELAAIANGGEPLEELEGVSGRVGANTFIAVFAAYYGRVLHELCRRDFRLYFRSEEAELNGHPRGRINVAGHIRNSLRGREHRIPCRWEEFTSDNWDNRILLAAARRLQQVVASFAPEAGSYIRLTFSGLEPWFSLVEEVPIYPSDFGRTRLWRTSRYYRNALAWARLIVQGLDRPVVGGNAPPLAIDANDAFERFARVVATGAVNSGGDRNLQISRDLPHSLLRESQKPLQPDFVISGRQSILAVGDAKYKEVLDQNPSPDELGDLPKGIYPKISSADWNQLYVYLRLAGASCGFFVVPFWNLKAKAAQLFQDLHFRVSPLDQTDARSRSVRLAVVGLNLLHPLRQVRDVAISELSRWLQGCPV